MHLRDFLQLSHQSLEPAKRQFFAYLDHRSESSHVSAHCFTSFASKIQTRITCACACGCARPIMFNHTPSTYVTSPSNSTGVGPPKLPLSEIHFTRTVIPCSIHDVSVVG